MNGLTIPSKKPLSKSLTLLELKLFTVENMRKLNFVLSVVKPSQLIWLLHYPSRHSEVVTILLRRHYPTLLWCRHIVAVEMLDDVAKTTLLQGLIKNRNNETLQRRRFCYVVWRFHGNYIATLRNFVVTNIVNEIILIPKNSLYSKIILQLIELF